MRLRLAVPAGLMTLMVGCSMLPGGQDPRPEPNTPAGAPSTTPQVPPRTSPDRPSPPVPDVRPEGLVGPPPGLGLERYRQQAVTWGPCRGGAHQCAEVLAPLDWADPDGDVALTLSLLRVPATAQPRLGTIFVNPGGPGEPGTGLAARFARKGLEQFDIVGWDPRGTGRSTPVACADGADLDEFFDVDVSPDDDAEREGLLRASEGFGRACLEHSGRLLQHISTHDTVADLDLLRALLGDEKLNFFGYSYGTDIGSRYAHTHPERVGRIVLDGAVDITGAEEVIQATGFDRALQNFADWCAAERCSLGRDRDSVLRAVTNLLDRLDNRPLRVGDRRLTQSQAVTGVIVALYGAEDEWSLLRNALQRARAGDGALLLQMADFYNARRDDGTYDNRLAAFTAIRCLDEGDRGVAGADQRATEQNEKAPVLGPYFGADYLCPLWPVRPVPAPEPVTAEGAAPILVIGATGDSATPYEHAQTMARQLASGVLLTYHGPGHGTYGGRSDCVDQAVVRYFTQEPPTADENCQ
ncbi:alpha/beta fold hydrolase [Granulicoccus sp. GXG6511]|uniref:alpha/beta fold hydrolase n=1 Tax=Granulicoccus sp. GXG6511 TaxID=3381351 RepID=UPI003D7E0081